MFGIFKMSEEKKLLLAQQNWISFRNMNDNQLRKYSGTAITPIKISYTTQKIVLLLDAMYKVASYSGKFTYKDISTNKVLYDIIGDYFITVLNNENYFPNYQELQEHSNLIVDRLFKKLIDDDNSFRNKIQS
jgi:hypothetical protein